MAQLTSGWKFSYNPAETRHFSGYRAWQEYEEAMVIIKLILHPLVKRLHCLVLCTLLSKMILVTGHLCIGKNQQVWHLPGILKEPSKTSKQCYL